MTPPDPAKPFTVIVPAHDEEAVIGRNLRALLDGWAEGRRPRVIVVCNGCGDGTAAAARAAAPEAEVIELAEASKTGAINEGLARTHAYPVIVVDADVAIGPHSLGALAAALREPGVMAASPVARIDVRRSDRWTRAYYRVWQRDRYLAAGVGGAGVYGLSRAAAERIGRFPPVIADDSFVRWSFPLSTQRRIAGDPVNPVYSEVIAPARLTGLLACEARWQAGNIELRRRMPEPTDTAAPGLAEGGRVPLRDRAVHFAVKLASRALYLANVLRGRSRGWHRGRGDATEAAR